MTQQERILKYMDDFGSITPMEAFMDLGITKLSSRISEMIRHGIQIEKSMEFTSNRYGQPVRFMRYQKSA